MRQAESPDDKLRAIVVCIHELELTHPFPDGNCRAIVMLLLNKLLVQNGFLPTLLASPDYFDAFSIDELCKEVTDGIQRFKEVKRLTYKGEQPLIYLAGNPIICHLVILEAVRENKDGEACASKSMLQKMQDELDRSFARPMGSSELTNCLASLCESLEEGKERSCKMQ